MRKKLLLYAAFFLALILGFYFALTRLIPGFGKVNFPVLSYVRPFHFQDQDGKWVSEQDLSGKVYVTEYFFTTCPNICPVMNANMRNVYERYRDLDGFVIVSHTCDPDRDSVWRLKHYADSLNIDTRRWWFLTGRKDSLYAMARNSYLLDDPKNNLQNIEDQFMHTQFFALVDRSGRVRKIYDGLKEREVEALIADIPNLMQEPASGTRFSNNLFGNSP